MASRQNSSRSYSKARAMTSRKRPVPAEQRSLSSKSSKPPRGRDPDDLGVLAADVDDQPAGGIETMVRARAQALISVTTEAPSALGQHAGARIPWPSRARPAQGASLSPNLGRGIGDVSKRWTLAIAPPSSTTIFVVREPTSTPIRTSAVTPRTPGFRGRPRSGCPSWPGVLLGVIGLDLEGRNRRLLEGGGDVDGLDVVGMAGVKDVLDDAVGPEIAGQADDVFDPLGVRRETGAIDGQIAVGDGFELGVEARPVSSTSR